MRAAVPARCCVLLPSGPLGKVSNAERYDRCNHHKHSERETNSHLCLAETRKLLFRWTEALSPKNIGVLLAPYAEEAILVPTLRNHICRHSVELEPNLKRFCQVPV